MSFYPRPNYKPTIIEQVLNFVQTNGPQRRVDIARFVIETIYHKPYTPENHRKYGGFPASFSDWRGGYFRRPAKRRTRYLKQLYNSKKYGVYDTHKGWLTACEEA